MAHYVILSPDKVSSPKSLLSHTKVVKTPFRKPTGIVSISRLCKARAVLYSRTTEWDMHCENPFSNWISSEEPVLCLIMSYPMPIVLEATCVPSMQQK